MSCNLSIQNPSSQFRHSPVLKIAIYLFFFIIKHVLCYHTTIGGPRRGDQVEKEELRSKENQEVEIKANGTLIKMVAVDWLKSDKREDDLAGRPGGIVQKYAAQGGNEFFFIVNIQLGVDIGSSTVARVVVSLVLGYLTNLVIEMAFLVQGNPRRLEYNHLCCQIFLKVSPLSLKVSLKSIREGRYQTLDQCLIH